MKIYQTCRVCKAIYFNKTWHRGDHVKVSTIKKSRFAWTTRCPACKMVESAQFEGQITITNIPSITSRELFYLIEEFCNRAYEKNCQHRLIEVIKQSPHKWIVTTTDKNLATALAKRISEAFDYVNVKPSDPDEPKKSWANIIVEFLPVFYHRFNAEAV